MLAPYISPAGLRGGFQYSDAQTDDARLVLRIIREAVAESQGGEGQGEWARALALNYARAESLLHDETGELIGVRLRDMAPGAADGRTV